MVKIVMVSELEAQANALLVDDEFQEAIDLYTEAIEQEPDNSSLYAGRAAAYIKIKKFTDAVGDATRAIELDNNSSKAYLRKGIACFHLEEYQTAKNAFTRGSQLDPSNRQLKQWIGKTEEKLAEESDEEIMTPETVRKVEVDTIELPHKDAQTLAEAPTPHEEPPPTQPTVSEAPKPPKFRHEWYQSPHEVVVTIFAKGITEEQLQVDFGEQVLSAVITLPEEEEPYALQLRLFAKISPSDSKVSRMKTKIEIKLKKSELIHWTGLEFDSRKGAVQPVNVSDERAKSLATSYPTSSKKNFVDWDKLEADIKNEEKDEKLEGDAALNKLFQDIYRNSDEDTRRAMNKSYVESKGTALSTNWKEIGAKKVKPHSS